MYYRLQERLAAARSSGGSALIEAVTYRLGDHTTADDASRYRAKEDVERHRAAEPIARLRKYLGDCGFWSQSQEQELQAEMAARLNQAAETYLARTPQPPEAMFEYLYAELPVALREQRDEVARRGLHD